MILIRGGDLFMFVRSGGNTGPANGYVDMDGYGLDDETAAPLYPGISAFTYIGYIL